MATISQSDQKAYETGVAFDQKVHATVAASLKRNYAVLKSELPNDLIAPPADDAAFNTYIEALADDVIDGKSERAQHIRQLLKTLKPDEYEALVNTPKMKSAAVEAVRENTGNVAFLGGSTIMNAVMGFLQWVFTGFSGGMKGLENIIANRTVDAIADGFKENLKTQGIDSTQGYGKDALQGFEQQLKVQAGLAQPDAKGDDTDLTKIKAPEKTAAAPTVGDLKNPADVDKALGDAANYIGQQATATLPLPKEMVASTQAAFSDAAKEMSARLLKDSKDGKGLPADFEFQLYKAAFEKMKPVLEKDASLDAQSKDLFNKTAAAFNQPGATLDSIQKSVPEAGVLIGLLHEPIANYKASVLEILTKANPSNETLKSQGKALSQNSAIDTLKNNEAMRASLKTLVKNTLDTSLDPTAIQTAFDAAIQNKINSTTPDNCGGWTPHIPFTSASFHVPGTSHIEAWLTNDTTARWAGYVPSTDERKQFAGFVSTNMKKIVQDEMNHVIDGKDRKFDVDAVTANAMKRFETAFDQGNLPASVVANKADIMAALSMQLHDSLAAKQAQIQGTLGSIVAVPDSSTQAPDSKSNAAVPMKQTKANSRG